MHRGHEAFFDAEAFLEQHVNQRREAVGRAGRVGNDVVLGRVVFVLVHAHDHGQAIALGRRGDDDFFGPGSQMALGLFHVREQTGRLDDHLHAEVFPRQLRGVLGADHAHLVAVDDEHVVIRPVGRAFLRAHRALESALGGIVFEQVGEIVRRHDVADGDDLHVPAHKALLDHRAIDQTANAPESVDCYFDSHNRVRFFGKTVRAW